MKTAKFLLALMLAASLAACGGGSPLSLNQQNLDKIQEGMTSAQVKAILGLPTESKTEPIPIVGGTKTTYTYSNKTSSAVIVLKNDTVQSKEGHFDEAR